MKTPLDSPAIPIFCAFKEMRRTASLKPHPRNPNRHPQQQIEIFAKIISSLGWRQPLVVSNRSGYVIKGHGKLLVANFLKLAEVPVDLQDYKSEEEEWQDLLADNRIAELSEREDSLVGALIRDLTAKGAQIELTGYDSKEIALLLAKIARSNPQVDIEPDIDHAAELRKKWGTETGQLWGCDDHRILVGDATLKGDVLRLYGALSNKIPPPRLMVTDPPYGVNYDPAWRKRAGINRNTRKMGKVANDARADWTPAWALFVGDVAYVWHGGLHAGTVASNLEAAGFEVRSQIIWRKDRFALSRGNYHWQHEPCWYAVRKGKTSQWTGQRDQPTVWDYPAREGDGDGHSTPKPLGCMRRPIENNSLIGSSVYDPFLGFGTTLVACEQTGRVCLGIDILPAYVAVTLDRWAKLTGRKPTLITDQ
jgi:DNA modification methylase